MAVAKSGKGRNQEGKCLVKMGAEKPSGLRRISKDCLTDQGEDQVIITANRNIVAIGRPHFGKEIFTYDGFNESTTNSKFPMVFKNAFGVTYNSALWISNLDQTDIAHITVKYYATEGTLTCTSTLSLPPLNSVQVRVPDLQECLP